MQVNVHCLTTLVFVIIINFAVGYEILNSSMLSRLNLRKRSEATAIQLTKVIDKSSPERSSRVCRRCKYQYESKNEACTFHPGIYSGRLNRVNDVDTSDLEYFWSCCGKSPIDAEGCVILLEHLSYDEDQPTFFSTLTGKSVTYKKLS
jgi:hypothetical protein